MSAKAVLLDRDGTLNVDTNYLHKVEELVWMPEALEALRYLKEEGYLCLVVTNQSGIARGYYTLAEMENLHTHMADEVRRAGGEIKRFYYCPHLEEGTVAAFAKVCDCRKPKPGLLLRAIADYNLDKESTFVVGDGVRDIEAATAAGLRGYRYKGGSLLDFVRAIVEQEKLT